MVGLGYDYSGDCNNGATEFLKWGGSVILIGNFLPAIYDLAVACSLIDGEVSSDEADCLGTLRFIKKALPLVTVVVKIWVGFVAQFMS